MGNASEKKHCLNCGYTWWPWDHCCANPRFEPVTKTPQEMAEWLFNELQAMNLSGYDRVDRVTLITRCLESARLSGLSEGKGLGLEEARAEAVLKYGGESIGHVYGLTNCTFCKCLTNDYFLIGKGQLCPKCYETFPESMPTRTVSRGR